MKIKLSGIYIITNKSTKQYYIGMSTDIFARWSSHYSHLKIHKHTSPKFFELWNKSNPTDWSFEILEVVSITEYKLVTSFKGSRLTTEFRKHLVSREKWWMGQYPKCFSLNHNDKFFK